MSWGQIQGKQGETISRYVHSFGDRDASTKLKPSTWAAPVDIAATVRSQPNSITIIEGGILEVEQIVLLTSTAIVKRDRFKWNSKYFEALSVDQVFFKGTRQYYKAVCIRVIEWSPPAAA